VAGAFEFIGEGLGRLISCQKVSSPRKREVYSKPLEIKEGNFGAEIDTLYAEMPLEGAPFPLEFLQNDNKQRGPNSSAWEPVYIEMTFTLPFSSSAPSAWRGKVLKWKSPHLISSY